MDKQLVDIIFEELGDGPHVGSVPQALLLEDVGLDDHGGHRYREMRETVSEGDAGMEAFSYLHHQFHRLGVAPRVS
jgi:hypothetical protein